MYITLLLLVWILYVFTSFSNSICAWQRRCCVWILYVFTSFSNTVINRSCSWLVWILYVFTSFSNYTGTDINHACLNTIRFYIILKQWNVWVPLLNRLNTIRFYIILKRIKAGSAVMPVWILYVFTSFSNTVWIFTAVSIVWILYVFTSFSNLKFKNEVPHTHIHYSIQPILINRLHIHLCQLYNIFSFLKSLFVYFQ